MQTGLEMAGGIRQVGSSIVFVYKIINVIKRRGENGCTITQIQHIHKNNRNIHECDTIGF